MAKLYATLENGKGKIVSLGDNEEIRATVYDGNSKAYSVIIEWCDMGDGEMGAIVTTREWRNEPDEIRYRGINKCLHKQTTKTIHGRYCLDCHSYL